MEYGGEYGRPQSNEEHHHHHHQRPEGDGYEGGRAEYGGHAPLGPGGEYGGPPPHQHHHRPEEGEQPYRESGAPPRQSYEGGQGYGAPQYSEGAGRPQYGGAAGEYGASHPRPEGPAEYASGGQQYGGNQQYGGAQQRTEGRSEYQGGGGQYGGSGYGGESRAQYGGGAQASQGYGSSGQQGAAAEYFSGSDQASTAQRYSGGGAQPQYSQTGGQQYNSPSHSGAGGHPQTQGRPQFDEDEVVRTASQQGGGESSLFSSALQHVQQNTSEHTQPIDEAGVQQAHKAAYQEGNARSLSAGSMGSAAAMQVMKMFTSGGGSSGGASGAAGGGAGSGSTSSLMSYAMAEASKLFDQSGGAASGNKQDAVNGAAMTVMKMLVQSKMSGTTGGSNSGGLSGLMGLASKFL